MPGLHRDDHPAVAVSPAGLPESPGARSNHCGSPLSSRSTVRTDLLVSVDADAIPVARSDSGGLHGQLRSERRRERLQRIGIVVAPVSTDFLPARKWACHTRLATTYSSRLISGD